MTSPPDSPIVWLASTKKDLMELPKSVRRFFGHALGLAQTGERHHKAKVLKHFGDAGVLEIVADDRGGTYRAVYTVRFRDAIFVLHVFQKKSAQGTATSRSDLELVGSRLKVAEKYAKEMDDEETHD
jgi:phage-related protein